MTAPEHIVNREAELRCVIADLTEQVREREAVLKQALSALEIVQADVSTTPNAYESQRQAIAAIKEILK